MRILIYIKLVVTSLILVSTAAQADDLETEIDSQQAKPLALVYSGPGACVEGDCAANAAAIVERAGYKVKLVTPSTILSNLPKAALWVQPGGEGVVARAAMGDEIFAALRKFVMNGGNFLGFCAGAYMAGPWLDNEDTLPGLDIIPAYTYEYSKYDRAPRIETIIWKGKKRQVYFQDGAAFRVDAANAHIIKATYGDGTPAIVFSPMGKGKVALVGPHPEAPADWAPADNLVDIDGEDSDIALEMISWLK